MIKAFIFDVDGTLVDTRKLHIDAWKRAFDEFDIEVSVEQIQSQLGRRSIDIAKTFLPKKSAEEIMRIVETKWRVFREFYSYIKPIPKTKELFDFLKSKGLALALATSANRQDADHHVDILSIKDIIGALVTGEDILHSKPHPEIFLKAAVELGINPKESVAVGDSPHDMESAKRAGMTTIGVLTGGYSKKDLLTAGADKVYRDIAELFGHIEEVLQSK